MALEALESCGAEAYNYELVLDAENALYAALAQPIISPEIKGDKAEPVAWQWLGTSVIRKRIPKTAEADAWAPLYTHPPQRQPLTEEEVHALVDATIGNGRCEFARDIERAHGIGP